MDSPPNRFSRILLIDDDEDEYVLLKDMASRTKRIHYTIDWVDSKEAAWTACREQSYDAFLVDYRLGAENGVELTRELVQGGVKEPIILLTGQGNYEIDEAAQQAGATDYLPKDNLSFSILERTIRYALEHKNTQAELERRVQERTWALQQSESRFRALTETTSAAIFIVKDMEIRYANPATKIVTGFEPEELIPSNFLSLVHPEYHSALEQHGLGNPWAPGLPSRYELKIIRKDGSERYLDLTTGPVEYENSPAWIVTAFDITERDLAEKELRKARHELEERVDERTNELRLVNEQLRVAVVETRKRADEIDALQNATSMLLSTIDLDSLLGNILDAACKATPNAEKGAIYLVTARTGELRMSASMGFKDTRLKRVSFVRIKGYADEAIHEKKPLMVKNTDGKTARNQRGRENNQSVIAAPLLLERRPLGALLLTSSFPEAFSERDLRLLETFAATAAVAISNAQLHADVQKMAVTDPLTGAFNRRGFFETSKYELERSRRYKHPLSIIYMDVDQFKSINDAYGHSAGDIVLKTIVDRSSHFLRQVDVIGRMGGDEFAILLPETNLAKARQIAERIRQVIDENPVTYKRKHLKISTTLGVTQAKDNIDHLEALIAEADKALYKAKNEGRNTVAFQ